MSPRLVVMGAVDTWVVGLLAFLGALGFVFCLFGFDLRDDNHD
ncbi:Protein of unknown function [Pyronema omphalodes CBS 100304]|uniref:Uncharacterized protein n=1 Tax=Pyronema omphalodes (strain CBS 100304) TaxID=1076935 RepID=U4L0V3_PYROM|nr:Protein of unknown function [Pyronema omphalodes CBS 100304]